jgi:hypothetical protein
VRLLSRLKNPEREQSDDAPHQTILLQGCRGAFSDSSLQKEFRIGWKKPVDVAVLLRTLPENNIS